MYTWVLVWAYHFDFHQARILEGIDDSVAWKTPDHELKQYLLVLALLETPTRVTTGAATLVTLQHPLQRCVLSGTPKKIVPATAGSFTNAPIAQAITPNAVVPLDLLQQVPTMPTHLRWDEDNSNPSMLYNLSRSRSLIL